ncbi:MAG: hypothetical protein ACQESM_02555 [Bacteroidota bacterium]
MLNQNFYIALGNLLYSVYYGDLLYKEMSRTDFFGKIKQHFIPREEDDDEFGTNNSFYCIFEIERLAEQHADPFRSFHIFEDYFANHKFEYSQKIKSDISALLNEILGKNQPNSSLTFVKKFQKL